MKIPKTIKIGGHNVEIRQDDKVMRDRGNHGASQCNDLWIELDNTTPETQQASTLLHEILEQVNYLYEIGLEHRQITLLESTLYQVLKDNELRF